jgi:hypothetical protein
MMRAPYTGLERALHRVAFAALPAQLALSDIEDRLYPVPEEPIDRPVFVTSLARAGTTLVLDILSGAPDLVSHTYRNMPFVLCPLIWNRLSYRFRRKAEWQERAHGDGMTIGFDSPEAFEEVLWKAHAGGHYRKDRILPWEAADRDPEFETFFRRHIGKLLSLAPGGRRYLSKNNANIARLPLLPELFPDCRIVIPIRNPYDHARSLMRQHRRFMEMHAADAFSRRYMEWLGHYEFGAALRPIDFDQWLDAQEPMDPARIDFWLSYWAVAYESILENAGRNATFIDFDALLADPHPALERLAAAAALPPASLQAAAGRLHAATDYGVLPEAIVPGLRDRIEAIHRRLKTAAARPVTARGAAA